MKKVFVISLLCILLCGCDIDSLEKEVKNATKPNVSCTISKQSKDKAGIAYYVEGTCTNNGSKDYDYLQIELICYDKKGNNLGTALDNTNNLLGGQTWKYKAMSLSSVDSIDHCDFHEVTGW